MSPSPPDGEYAIVPYHPGLKDQIVQLPQSIWGPDPEMRRAYFEWKYEQNPYIAWATLCVALHRGAVVGMRGLYGAKWQIGTSGRTVVIPYTDDFMIAPEHRDRGLALRLIGATLASARENGYSYLLSLRAGPLNLLASLAAGYRSIGAMEPVARNTWRADLLHFTRRFVHQRRFFWRFSEAPVLQAEPSRSAYFRLDRAARKSRPSGQPPVRIESAPRPGAMAEMLERLPPDDRIRHVRDAEYLAWVFRNPRFEYRFLFWEEPELEGYLVLHRSRSDGPEAARVWIVDWEATSDRVLGGLLEAALRQGRFSELATWTATCPDSAKVALTRRGFVPTDLEARARGRPAAIVRTLRDEELDLEWAIEGRTLTDIDNWKFRLLDQD